MTKTLLIFIVLVIGISMSSCSNLSAKPEDTPSENSSSKMSSPHLRVKKVHGLELSVRFVSTDELVMNELKSMGDNAFKHIDSLIKYYNQSRTFVLTIAPDEEKMSGDVMYHNVKDYRAYKERVNYMSFNIDEYVKIEANGVFFKSVLSHMEPIYGLKESREIRFVFVPNKNSEKAFYNAEKIDFIYDDEVFGTGINHFVFTNEDLLLKPHFDLKKFDHE